MLPQNILEASKKFKLIKKNEKIRYEKLDGGVSSDIWAIHSEKYSFCVKKSLDKLKVKENWRAPKVRNQYEVKYLNTVRELAPNPVPHIHGHNPADNVFAMNWYDPKTYRTWKEDLLKKHINFSQAIKVSKTISLIHNNTAKKKSLSLSFSNDKIFNSIRIEPYFEFVAKVYPDFSSTIFNQIESIKSNKKVLIHGDLSPKNILISKRDPIILDAECTNWGDPAFDIAFCINHFILKSLYFIKESHNKNFVKLCDIFLQIYFKEVSWESINNLESRIIKMLPILILARVDGKSPVEYFKKTHKTLGRNLAIKILNNKIKNFDELKNLWERFIGRSN